MANRLSRYSTGLLENRASLNLSLFLKTSLELAENKDMKNILFLMLMVLSITVNSKTSIQYEEASDVGALNEKLDIDPMSTGFFLDLNFESVEGTFPSYNNRSGRLNYFQKCSESWGKVTCLFTTKETTFQGTTGQWHVYIVFPKKWPGNEFVMKASYEKGRRNLAKVNFKKKEGDYKFKNLFELNRLDSKNAECKVTVSKRGRKMSHKELYGPKSNTGNAGISYYYRKIKGTCSNYMKMLNDKRSQVSDLKGDVKFAFDFIEVAEN